MWQDTEEVVLIAQIKCEATSSCVGVKVAFIFCISLSLSAHVSLLADSKRLFPHSFVSYLFKREKFKDSSGSRGGKSLLNANPPVSVWS